MMPIPEYGWIPVAVEQFVLKEKGKELWEFSGYLWQTDEEHSAARRLYAFYPKEARKIMEHQRDGYWDNDKFMANIRKAVRVAEF